MALKDFLVYVDQTEDSLARLRLAVDLAARNDSRLTAIFVKEWSRDQLDLRKAAELGLVSAAGLDSLDRRTQTSIDAAAERLQSTLETLARKRPNCAASMAWHLSCFPSTRVTPISASWATTSRKARPRSTIPSRSSCCS